MALQALKHAAGFDCEDEFRIGLEGKLFDGRGNRISTRSEARAVDSFDLSGFAVGIENDEPPRNGASVFIGDETQLFALRATK